MKQVLHILLLLFVAIPLGSCQNQQEAKEKKMIEKFEWTEGTNAALGYPMEVYRGGLDLASGGYVGLFNGTIDGSDGWGDQSGGTSHGVKSLPTRLNVIYLSYAENQFYHIDCAIDYDRLLAVFKQPLRIRGAYDNLMPRQFNQVLIGFAPGGVVVVWASGSGTVIEIGRYQGEKTVIPQAEIDRLDPAGHVIFEKDYVDYIMGLTSIIPKTVQEANKDKPIPFGLWDSYRARYHWRPLFQVQNGGKMGDYGFTYFNGEMDDYVYEENIQSEKDKELFYQVQADSVRLAIPSEIGFSWFDQNKQEYAGYFKFNEEEIMKAFQYLCGAEKDTRIEMVVRPNISNSYATVLLRASNGKEIALSKHDEDNFFMVKPRK